MITLPLEVEFTLEKSNLIFKIDSKNNLLGRTVDSFEWYDVLSFSVEDIKNGKLGCLECFPSGKRV